MKRTSNILTGVLIAATAALMPLALWMAFLYAPDEKVMGAVQRVFYFHVPAAIVSFASTFVMLGASMGYLWTRRRGFDRVSLAATELALFFCTVVLVTGPIWARPAWGVWWTWEARLTTTLVLWLLLAACLMVRRYAENPDQGARLASVLGIVAALDVPIIYKAVEWWRGQHPVVFGPGKRDAMDPQMKQTFLVCLLVFFVLYALMLALRTRLASLEDRVRDLAESAAAR